MRSSHLKKLKLTALGRSLLLSGKERSGIRRIDRLLGNRYYQTRSVELYRAMALRIVCNQGRPVILVDWTSVPNSHWAAEEGEHSVLRASMIAEGRSITLYEEVHSKQKENTHQVHQAFLKTLRSILPPKCCPYIITDAGFRNPWFREVLALGWDYIGRVRGSVHYEAGTGYLPIKTLFNLATGTPKFLGEFNLSKDKALKTNFYLYRHQLVGRKRLTRAGKEYQHKDSKNYAKSYREPWILVSSLKGYTAVKRVIKLYKLRMTIESAFRDSKSSEFGFGMKDNNTIKPQRYIVWMMLAALAALVAWIIGYAAEKKKLHYDFQANTYRHRRVLSFVYLGCQIVIKKIDIPIVLDEIQRSAWDSFSWKTLC